MLTCKFSCKLCGIKKASVEVPAREGSHQDVLQWMKQVVIPAISIEHDRLSPNCHPESLQDIMIPCEPNAEFLGQQIE